MFNTTLLFFAYDLLFPNKYIFFKMCMSINVFNKSIVSCRRPMSMYISIKIISALLEKMDISVYIALSIFLFYFQSCTSVMANGLCSTLLRYVPAKHTINNIQQFTPMAMNVKNVV